MILDEITLHNFGLYGDRQTIELTPPSAEKPVILIGGLNGGGKTTLLDALQLCLYGPHARTSNRGSIGYHDYLGRCIHRDSAGREAAIELAFRHTVEGAEDQYRLHRSWRLTPSGCKERFEVLRNGRFEPALAENWISHVEELMPANIAHLFLFDGEQIESYASFENSSALIGAAIQNLLGLDVVDQLEKDLQVYERRKRALGKDDAVQSEIALIEKELRDLHERSDALARERASLQSHKIDQKRKVLSKLEDDFRKHGGELFEQRGEIEVAREQAEKEVTRFADDLRELAAGPLPLLVVRDMLEGITRRDQDEQGIRRARDLSEALSDRDDALVKHLRKHGADKDTLSALKAFIIEDRALRSKIASRETVLDLLPDARTDLHVLLSEGLQAASKNVAEQLYRKEKADAQAEFWQLQFDSIPASDVVAEIAAKRDALVSEIARLEGEHAAIGSEIERVFRDVERKEQSLTRLLEAEAKVEGARQDRIRILEHTRKVRETLAGFRRAVIERHVRRIEQLVLESYQQLLRKSSLVSRLTIDPDNFSLTLFGRDGLVLGSERLSAGERQLLAIALLWGLAKASGRPLPTAIDTPLGRLDTEHRMHLVERYFPLASHQVLLLSTDEEITGDYLARLGPYIGRVYRLLYDDATGKTEVQPGYFETRKAA